MNNIDRIHRLSYVLNYHKSQYQFLICLMLTLVLGLLSSCQSDQKVLFQELKAEYSALINEEYNEISNAIENGITLEAKLKSYLLEYPNANNSSEVELWLNNLEKDLADVVYRLSLKNTKSIQNKNFVSYAEAIQNYDQLILELQSVLDYFYQEQFLGRILQNIGELELARNTLQEEESDYNMIMSEFRDTYSISVANNEIDRITEFLNYYESSIMKNSLTLRIENLQMLKFDLLNKELPESIKELNDIISSCMLIESRVSNVENKNKIKTAVSQWDNKRDQILREEWELSVALLKSEMEEIAVDYCNEYVHGICHDVINVNLQNCERKDFLGSSILSCNYEIQAKGGFFCGSVYEVIINVRGTVSGDSQNGAFTSNDSSRLIRDTKIN